MAFFPHTYSDNPALYMSTPDVNETNKSNQQLTGFHIQDLADTPLTLFALFSLLIAEDRGGEGRG